jgi:hypothetical protein
MVAWSPSRCFLPWLKRSSDGENPQSISLHLLAVEVASRQVSLIGLSKANPNFARRTNSVDSFGLFSSRDHGSGTRCKATSRNSHHSVGCSLRKPSTTIVVEPDAEEFVSQVSLCPGWVYTSRGSLFTLLLEYDLM